MSTPEDPDEDRRPPSQRIADDLRAAIEGGQYGAGDVLPSERELARRYGAARNTAREALRLLAVAGLVVIEHGRGSYVRSTGPLIRLGSDRYSPRHRDAAVPPFRAECARQGKVGRVEMLSVERVVPPPEFAARLGLAPTSSSVVRRESVSYADDDAVRTATTEDHHPGRVSTDHQSHTLLVHLWN